MTHLIATIAFLFAPATAFGQTLSVVGSCPGTLDIDVGGIQPGGGAAFIYSRDPGSSAVPAAAPTCAGTPLDLDRPKLYRVLTADVDGNIGLTPTLTADKCGTTIQVMDTETCRVTSAVKLATNDPYFVGREFPRSSSTVYKDGIGLGTIASGHYMWVAGEYVEDSTGATGISSLSRVTIDAMVWDSAQGCGAFPFRWEVTINGNPVGAFFTYPTGSSTINPVSTDISFDPIFSATTEYTIRMTALDTICGGGGSYQWQAGGSTRFYGQP